MPKNKNSWEIQQDAHIAAVREFREACARKQTDRVQEWLITGPLTLRDTLNYLRNGEDVDHDVARFLLRNGVDPNDVPSYGSMASHRGYRNREFMDVLVECGWDVQNLGPQLLIDQIDDREWVEWIVGKGIDLNKPTRHNRFIRQMAQNPGSTSPAERDETVGCLNLAAKKGDIELFDYFVAHGADPSRSIALHRATQCKDPKKTIVMISHLIDNYHMNPMADDKCGGLRWIYGLGGSEAMEEFGTPMRFAKVYNNDAAIEALFRYKAKSEGGAEWAARKGNLAMLRMFLEGGDDAGKSAVYAIEYGHDEALKLCVELGAKKEDYQDAIPGKMLKYVAGFEGSEEEISEEEEIEE